MCFSRWDVQQVFMDALRLAGFTVKSVLVWDRMHHGMGDLKGSFAPRYDTCIFATKGRYILPNGRQYIGIEISAEHHATAQRRALEATKTRLRKGAEL